MKHYDCLIIGGGSGGIAMANAAAELGVKTALFEPSAIGGTCVNRGCVPKKLMYNLAKTIYQLNATSNSDYISDLRKPAIDWLSFNEHCQKYIQNLHNIYHKKLSKNRVDIIHEMASFQDQTHIKAGAHVYTSKNIVIATGASAIRPTLPGTELGWVSDDLFNLNGLPKSLAIIGGGYIAVEMACILQMLGVNITLIMRSKIPLKAFDELLGNTFMAQAPQFGMKILCDKHVSALKPCSNGIEVLFEQGDSIVTDKVLWAIGRSPLIQSLNIERAELETHKGAIKVDAYQNTNQANIFAIGDVTGIAPLTPVAIATGRTLAQRLFANKDCKVDFNHIPSVVFSYPPMATIGLSELEARNKHDGIKVYHSEFTPMDQAFANPPIKTKMKLVVRTEDEQIIGIHMVGLHTDEILQGFAVAIKMGANITDFKKTIAIHPTSAEELVTMR